MGVGKIAESALDMLYPPRIYCDICGNLIDESRTYALCDRCISRMKWDRDPVQELGGVKMLRCAEYGIYERTMIFNLKYRGRKYIARDIAEIMRDRLRITDASFEVIVPVPLSPERLRTRGFNQTALIGRHLAEMTETVQVEDALLRTRNTRPMHGLSPEERETNIRGVFRVNPDRIPDLSGRRILMLDDFATTGATAREMCRALREAGPADEIFLSFAARYGEAIRRNGDYSLETGKES